MTDWCNGVTWTAKPAHQGTCDDCGRRLHLVGGAVFAGWGRTRLPRHKALAPASKTKYRRWETPLHSGEGSA